MRIPVFLSSPSLKNLNPEQKQVRKLIEGLLQDLNLDPRTLGSSDYPTRCPLQEVLVIASHCCGGVILGFEQIRADNCVKATSETISTPVAFPTPWNNLEAGILFSLRLPLLVFKEDNIGGGVFDHGVTDVFVHKMPLPGVAAAEQEGLKDVFLSWQRDVRARYYQL